jgi:hypothetical protein
MVAMVVSTLEGVPSIRVAEASNPVGVLPPVGVVMHAGAWGREAAVEDVVSTEAVVTKVLVMLLLLVILFKANLAGQQVAVTLQVIEKRIGEDRGITTTIFTVIIEQVMGTIRCAGLVRIMWEGVELFSLGSEEIMMP